MDLSPDNWLFVAPFQTSLDMDPMEAFKLQVCVPEALSRCMVHSLTVEQWSCF